MHRTSPARTRCLSAAPTVHTHKSSLSEKLHRNFSHTEMSQKHDLFCFSIPSHWTTFDFVWRCFRELPASGVVLGSRQNIRIYPLLLSQLIFHSPDPRNRKTHQGYTLATEPRLPSSPTPIFVCSSFHSKLLFDRKDQAAERLPSLLVRMPTDGTACLLPWLFPDLGANM